MSEQTTETVKIRDYSQYLTKAPSSLHEGFAKYIQEKTGVETVDVKVIQLALALHGEYQASPENKARQEQEKVEREAAKAAAQGAKKGGPRSPEARELKKLQSAVGALKELDQPVPSKTVKRIAELEAILMNLPADHKIEVPAQQTETPVETPETVDA